MRTSPLESRDFPRREAAIAQARQFEVNAVGVVPRELPRLLSALPVLFVKNRDTGQHLGVRALGGHAQQSMHLTIERDCFGHVFSC
jgi:hypothetical protein